MSLHLIMVHTYNRVFTTTCLVSFGGWWSGCTRVKCTCWKYGEYMHSIQYNITYTHDKNNLRQYLHTGSETFTRTAHLVSHRGWMFCTKWYLWTSNESTKYHSWDVYTDECSAVVYSISTGVQRHAILWIIHAHKDWCSATITIHCSHYLDKTNNVLDKQLCHELLTWSVTGTEPDQVLLCQDGADFRIQSTGHQRASTINYRSMRCDIFRSTMLKAKKSIFRNRIIVM